MLVKWLFVLIAAAMPISEQCFTHTSPPRQPTSYLSATKDRSDESVVSLFRLEKLGFGSLIVAIRQSSGPSIYSYTIRNNDIDNPGNYYMLPFNFSEIQVSLEDKVFLNNLLSKYLPSEYYSESIVDSIENIFLDDLNRKEFFFEANLNSTRFRFSGWYGKFAHIFVFTEFDSREGLIKAAEQYFNLPPLDKKNVSYDEEDIDDKHPDFFYSYVAEEIDFKLIAYPNLKYDFELKESYYDGVILDLTVYPEEE